MTEAVVIMVVAIVAAWLLRLLLPLLILGIKLVKCSYP